MSEGPGIGEMLANLIARDTTHQKQWMGAIEDIRGLKALMPIPNSFPQEENRDFSDVYLGFEADGSEPARGRWSEGSSVDGNGELSAPHMEPMCEEPALAPAPPNSGAQEVQESDA